MTKRFPITQAEFMSWLKQRGNEPCGSRYGCPLKVAVRSLKGQTIYVGSFNWGLQGEQEERFQLYKWAQKVITAADKQLQLDLWRGWKYPASRLLRALKERA